MPAACCIALLIIALCEAAINRFDYYFYKPDYQSLRIAIKNAVSQTRACDFDVITLGDCYLTVGFIPALLKEKTGLSSFNFSTNQRCTVVSAYAMLKNYLGTCAKKPHYIVMSFIHSSLELSRESIIDAMPFNYCSSFYDIRRGSLVTLIKEFGLELGLRLLMPSLNHQERIKDFLSQRSLYCKQTFEKVDNFIESVYAESGYYPYRVDDMYNGGETDQEEQKPFVVSSLFSCYVAKILDLAKAHGIKVIYVFPAVEPDILAACKKRGVLEKNLNFFKNLQKDYPNLVIADPQHLITGREMFVDKIHLNGKGARVLTTFLADSMKTY